MNYFKVSCPGERGHTKRVGDNRVSVDKCSALLTFIGTDETIHNEVIPCRNCKSLIHVSLDDGEMSLAVLPKETKLKTVDGRCTVDEY